MLSLIHVHCETNILIPSSRSRGSLFTGLSEHLESINHVTDAIECFHEMENDLGEELEDDQARWILRE